MFGGSISKEKCVILNKWIYGVVFINGGHIGRHLECRIRPTTSDPSCTVMHYYRALRTFWYIQITVMFDRSVEPEICELGGQVCSSMSRYTTELWKARYMPFES